MPSFAKTAVGGLVAGLVAAAAMELFQKFAAPAMGQAAGEGDPATVKAADRVSVAVTGEHLSAAAKGPAGETVHFVTGAALGLAYGVLVTYAPSLKTGFGTGYGLATNVLVDNAIVPLAGLGAPPQKTDAKTQAYGALSHLVFGAVLEGVRGVLADAGPKPADKPAGTKA